MSDNPENTDPKAQEREDGTKSRTLKDATHKLKAEALRRYQLGDAEYDSEGAKTDDGRQGSSSDKNVGDTEKDGEKIDSVNPDSPSKGEDDDLNGDNANDEESREDESFGGDSSKPNEGNVLEDSVHSNNMKSDKENVQRSEISENGGGETSTDVKDKDINNGNYSVREGEIANEISKPQSEDTSRVSNSQDKPVHVRGSRPGSASSLPGSGKERPTSESEGFKKGEEGYQKPSSRLGSRDGDRSRPGSGADKRAKEEEQNQQLASGIGGSGIGRRSRPQSGDKGGAADQESGDVTQDGSTVESPGDAIAQKDGALIGDEIVQTADGLSQSKTNGGEIKEGGTAARDDASLVKINEGVSQTEGKDLTEQGQGHHSDKSVSENVIADNNTETVSVENSSNSKQTGDHDKISDDVSPPTSEEAKSKDVGEDSKQNRDSLSNNKQDPAVAEGNKEENEGENSKESKGDKEKTESSDGRGQINAESDGKEDSSGAMQTDDSSKDSKEQIVRTDKGELSTEPGEGKKEQEDDAGKSELEEGEGRKAVKRADQEGGDEGHTGESSDAKVKEEGKEGDITTGEADETKKDESEKKKKKKKAKKEGEEKQESLEEDGEEKADGTGKGDGEAQPGEPKQTVPGKL